jgi:hypothetical protein
MRTTAAISRHRAQLRRAKCQRSPWSATCRSLPGILWEQGVVGSNPAAPIIVQHRLVQF